MCFCGGAGEQLELGRRRSGVVEIGVGVVLASLSALLCPSGGPGCLTFVPVRSLRGFSSRCFSLDVPLRKRRWKVVLNTVAGVHVATC